jgi:hypothetical protein
VKLKPGTAASTAVHFAQLNNPNLHVQSIYVQAGAVLAARKALFKFRAVEADIFGNLWEECRVEAIVRWRDGKDAVCVLPECIIPAEFSGALTRLGFEVRFRVELGDGEVAVDPCNLSALPVRIHHLVHGRMEGLTERALEIRVLDDDDGRIRVAEDMVTLCERLHRRGFL